MTPQPPNENEVSGASAACDESHFDVWPKVKAWAWEDSECQNKIT